MNEVGEYRSVGEWRKPNLVMALEYALKEKPQVYPRSNHGETLGNSRFFGRSDETIEKSNTML